MLFLHFVFRAEKSEVLTEDQQGNEKRVDIVRQVSHNLIKKITALLEAPPGTDPEKRLVNNHFYSICSVPFWIITLQVSSMGRRGMGVFFPVL